MTTHADQKTEKRHGIASITVVIPVRNEERHIARTLDQLLELNRDGLRVEYLVIDGQSTDRTREIVSEYAARNPEVRLLDNPGRLSSSARNIGIQQSDGDVVLIIDGHCEIPTRSYLQHVAEAFDRTGADCLGRPQPLDVSDATWLQRAIAVARSSWLGHHPDSYIYAAHEQDVPAISVAVAYRRRIFEKVGLFDPQFDACEDCELNHRIDQAGMRCRFVPQLAIKYQPRNSLSGLFRQLVRYGRGRVRLFRKHPVSFSASTILPAIFFCSLIVLFVLALAIPVFWYVQAILVTMYAACIVGMSTFLSVRERQVRYVYLLPVVFVTIHVASGVGVLREFFTR